MKFLVHLFGRPTEVHGILAHLQSGCGHASGVDSLARSVKHLMGNERINGFGRTSHIGDFAHAYHSVFDKVPGIFSVQLVLRGARQSDIALHFPRTAACHELSPRKAFRIGAANIVPARTKFQHVRNLFFVEPVFVINVSVGTGNSHHLGAHLCGLLGSAPGYIAESADGHALAPDVDTFVGQHFTHKIEPSISGGLGAHQRATEFKPFSGEHTAPIPRKLLILPEEVAHFSCPHTDITSRDVDFRTDITVKLVHESLTETHDFGIALAAWRKIGTSLTSPHGQCGQCIFECLLKTKELQYGKVHGRMETQSTLIRADGTVELYPITQVDLNLSLVVHPRDPEHDDAFRLHQPFD